jgi:hypothetical protein
MSNNGYSIMKRDKLKLNWRDNKENMKKRKSEMLCLKRIIRVTFSSKLVRETELKEGNSKRKCMRIEQLSLQNSTTSGRSILRNKRTQPLLLNGELRCNNDSPK